MFILDTDASDFAIGAVLSQMQNNQEKVIAYASHSLTKSEKQYCATRKELLAVHKYILQFKHYLWGKPFLVRTDHKALVWFLNWKTPNTSQYMHWKLDLEEYDFKIEHRNGKNHVNADFLSRLKCEQCELNHEDPKKDVILKFIQKQRQKVFMYEN